MALSAFIVTNHLESRLTQRIDGHVCEALPAAEAAKIHQNDTTPTRERVLPSAFRTGGRRRGLARDAQDDRDEEGSESDSDEQDVDAGAQWGEVEGGVEVLILYPPSFGEEGHGERLAASFVKPLPVSISRSDPPAQPVTETHTVFYSADLDAISTGQVSDALVENPTLAIQSGTVAYSSQDYNPSASTSISTSDRWHDTRTHSIGSQSSTSHTDTNSTPETTEEEDGRLSATSMKGEPESADMGMKCNGMDDADADSMDEVGWLLSLQERGVGGAEEFRLDEFETVG